MGLLAISENWEFWGAVFGGLALLITFWNSGAKVFQDRRELRERCSALRQDLKMTENNLAQKNDAIQEVKEDRNRIGTRLNAAENRIEGLVRRYDSDQAKIRHLEAELRDRVAAAGQRPESAVLAEKEQLIQQLTESERSLQEEADSLRQELVALTARVESIDQISAQSWRLGYMPLEKLTGARLAPLAQRTLRTVSFVNQKGGVGKTTLCFNFGHQYGLANPDQRVLLVDLDSQGNLARLCSERVDAAWRMEQSESIWAHFVATGEVDLGRFADPSSHAPNVSVLAASRSMNNFEGEMYRLFFGAAEGRDPRGVFLGALAEAGEWDLVCFDCPPARGMITESAILASDFFVIPAEAADYTVEGALRVVESIRSLHAELTGEALSHSRLRMYMNKVKRWGGEPIAQQQLAIGLYEKEFQDIIAGEECWIPPSPGILAAQTEGPSIIKSGSGTAEKSFVERLRAAYADFITALERI